MNRLAKAVAISTVISCVAPSLASDLFQALSKTQDKVNSPTNTSLDIASAPSQSIDDTTIIRNRKVHINMDILDAINDTNVPDLTFNLFDKVNFSGTITHREIKGPETLILVGQVIGHRDSSFSLVRHKGILVGNIRASAFGSFQIRYVTNGVHEIRDIDETQFPPCGTDLRDQIKAVAAAPALQNAGSCDDDGSIIDMLVVYTEQARVGEGGTAAMEALIALSELETNQSYANSLINNTRINVVLTYEVDYVESGDSGTDRAALTDPTDGFMDEIHDLRREYAADVVAMIVNGFEVCGRASFSISAGNIPHPEIAFNVVKASCSAGNYTFGHELAHNQGCRHNRERDPSDGGAFLYSHGYREPAGLFRTVMGGLESGVPRIQYFSNPNVMFDGVPTGLPGGDPASADNAQTIENTSYNVANFRRSNDCNQNGICDDVEIATGVAQDCNNNSFPDDCDGDCNGNGFADDCDINIGLSIDCTNNGIPDECESDCNVNNIADSCDIQSGFSLDSNTNGVGDECEPPILYVDQNATGLGTGINWLDAFLNLHTALDVAAQSNGLVEEIWVAQGIYKPAPPDGDRLKSFELVSSVGVFGGFFGGETSRSQRNAAVNTTVLSGDLNSDDGPNFANNSENSHTVITSFAIENGASTILDGFTITGGHASDAISSTYFNGGGMSVWNGSPTISNCLFVSNQAYGGGGLYIHNGSAATVSRCRFIGNSSINHGAGISVSGESTPTIRDCVFLDNRDSSVGAGLSATIDSYLSVSHCTFVDNMASTTGEGGAVTAVAGAKIDLEGCILWNTVPTSNPILVAKGDSSVVTIQHSLILGGTSGTSSTEGGVILQGSGNIDADPLLAPDRIHILPGSPCIDRGVLNRDPIELDIDGESRVRNCIADLGADESDFFSDCNNNGQPDACDITSESSKDVNQSNVPDECELQLTLYVDMNNCPNTGTGTVFDPFCNIQTAIDSVDMNEGTGVIIHVADGTYTGDGNRNIQFGGRAIVLVSVNGSEQCILDAQGVSSVFNFDSGDVHLVIIDGLTITGGNALSGGGINIDQASIIVNNCLIEGNTATSGGGIFVSGAQATISNCTITNNQAQQGGGLFSQEATLRVEDSFILSNMANGFSIAEGGGLWLDGGSTTVINSLIDSNSAVNQFSGGGFGGGMYLRDRTHHVENCTISRNFAGGPGSANPTDRLGGGLYLDVTLSVLSDVSINNCKIRENIARRGGGMYSRAAIATVNNSTIEDNIAQLDDFLTDGAGVSMVNGNLLFQDCVIRRNRSVNGQGGGFSCVNGALVISQCQVTGNEAFTVGGAVYNSSNIVGAGAQLDLAGCTLAGNVSGGEGAGVYLRLSSSTASQVFNLFNTVIWGNTGTAVSTEENQIFYWCNGDCQNILLHNCIEGWTGTWGGVGNIGEDPNFVDLDGLDNIIGTDDDDLHVNGGSPVIDAGDNAAVPFGIIADFDGNPRFANDPSVVDTGNGISPLVDMGIYEGGVDCNGNGVADLEDITNGTSQDCTGNGFPDECELDCNVNGSADSCDIANSASTDCNSNGIPDECDNTNCLPSDATCQDCNGNAILDECDIANCPSGVVTCQDCDGNGIPDECDPDCDGDMMPNVCEIAACLPSDPSCQDCNNNAITDGCDIANCSAGDSSCQDCDGNGVPDGCDADCDSDLIPDNCEIAGCPIGDLSCQDCNNNSIPDECDIAVCTVDPSCNDCNNNSILDECDLTNCPAGDITCQDCDNNGIPDECDLATGAMDINGNNILDRCELFSLTASGITKDRYLSFDPSSNVEKTTAIRVTRTGSSAPWYVSCSLQNAGIDGMLTELLQAPEYCEWTDSVIHVRGCEIVPGNEYFVEATEDNVIFSTPLQMFTTAPQANANRQFGDLVGGLASGTWTAPDGIVSANDIVAVVQKFQLLSSAPHLSRVDNDGQTPNGLISGSDILREVIAFAGGDFGFGVTNCLVGKCVPSCP